MLPNATKLCYKSVFLQFSYIILLLLMRITQNLLIHFQFFLACFAFLFLFFFSPFLFSLSSTFYPLSIH